jgi:GNAT superfamily N-acetyltransferase
VVDVRAATEADCEDIYRIHVDAIHGLPGGSQGKAGIEEWLAGQNPSVYAQSMTEDSFIVAEDDGIVGWGSLSVPKKEIRNVFVDPAFHRRRVGTAILAGLEELAGQAVIDIVQLQATGTAIEFYLANGYQSDPPVAPGADWAMMKKRLA